MRPSRLPPPQNGQPAQDGPGTNTDSSNIKQEVDEISQGLIDKITKIADGDDWLVLRLVRAHSEVNSTHKERLMAERDAAVQRLRDAGVPMTEIADEAGVTDSYLARRVIKRGSPRIKPRRRQRTAE